MPALFLSIRFLMCTDHRSKCKLLNEVKKSCCWYILSDFSFILAESPIPINIVLSINHSALVNGDMTNFEIDPSWGLEASELYPDVKYTTVEEYLDQFVWGTGISCSPVINETNSRIVGNLGVSYRRVFVQVKEVSFLINLVKWCSALVNCHGLYLLLEEMFWVRIM